jgi:hypothetical protein
MFIPILKKALLFFLFILITTNAAATVVQAPYGLNINSRNVYSSSDTFEFSVESWAYQPFDEGVLSLEIPEIGGNKPTKIELWKGAVDDRKSMSFDQILSGLEKGKYLVTATFSFKGSRIKPDDWITLTEKIFITVNDNGILRSHKSFEDNDRTELNNLLYKMGFTWRSGKELWETAPELYKKVDAYSPNRHKIEREHILRIINSWSYPSGIEKLSIYAIPHENDKDRIHVIKPSHNRPNKDGAIMVDSKNIDTKWVNYRISAVTHQSFKDGVITLEHSKASKNGTEAEVLWGGDYVRERKNFNFKANRWNHELTNGHHDFIVKFSFAKFGYMIRDGEKETFEKRIDLEDHLYVKVTDNGMYIARNNHYGPDILELEEKIKRLGFDDYTDKELWEKAPELYDERNELYCNWRDYPCSKH